MSKVAFIEKFGVMYVPVHQTAPSVCGPTSIVWSKAQRPRHFGEIPVIREADGWTKHDLNKDQSGTYC